MQEKLESSRRGRAFISVGLALAVIAMLIANMPASVTKTALMVPTRVVVNATGMRQDWGVFAPNPRNTIIAGEARIDFANGASAVVHFPPDPTFFNYSNYRWRKFAEVVRANSKKELWPLLAGYLMRNLTRPGHSPVARVSLIRRWSNLAPPGVTPDHSRWMSNVYYVMKAGNQK